MYVFLWILSTLWVIVHWRCLGLQMFVHRCTAIIVIGLVSVTRSLSRFLKKGTIRD